MSSLRLLPLLALLLLSFAPIPQKRQKGAVPKWPTPHLGTLDAARTEAAERNAVLAIFVIQEGEEANDRFRDKVWTHPDIVRRCNDLVVILVNDGEHDPVTIREKKGKETVTRKVCSVFGTPTCEDHRRYFDRVFQEFNEDGVMRTPQLILVLPGGKVHGRLIDEHEVGTIAKKIDRARTVAGPSLTVEQLGEVKKDLSGSRAAQDAGNWVRAWQGWTRVLALCTQGEFAEEAKEGVDIALEGMREELKEAQGFMANGDVARGYAKLLEFKTAWKETPLAKDAAKAVSEAEKNKEWKEEIEAYRREVAADELWEKIRVAIAEDKERTAERHAKKILSRFGDTRAADRVRKEFPHLVESGGGG